MSEIILESAINYLSFDELDIEVPQSDVVALKRLHSAYTSKHRQLQDIVNDALYKISKFETRMANDELKGLSFHTRYQTWQATRMFNGKANFIKTSVDKQTVIDALIKFCNLHNIYY